MIRCSHPPAPRGVQGVVFGVWCRRIQPRDTTSAVNSGGEETNRPIRKDFIEKMLYNVNMAPDRNNQSSMSMNDCKIVLPQYNLLHLT